MRGDVSWLLHRVLIIGTSLGISIYHIMPTVFSIRAQGSGVASGAHGDRGVEVIAIVFRVPVVVVVVAVTVASGASTPSLHNRHCQDNFGSLDLLFLHECAAKHIRGRVYFFSHDGQK